MPYKNIEDRRANRRSYQANKRATDPDYLSAARARTRECQRRRSQDPALRAGDLEKAALRRDRLRLEVAERNAKGVEERPLTIAEVLYVEPDRQARESNRRRREKYTTNKERAAELNRKNKEWLAVKLASDPEYAKRRRAQNAAVQRARRAAAKAAKE